MKRSTAAAVALALLLAGTAELARAEVKTVQMKIAGYLCGN
jgi:hypothetical protein